MSDRFITAIGGYLPLLRLERKAAAGALRFAGLGGRRDGHRAVAGWDEDALTLAVEAARGPAAGGPASALVFASTSAYFIDRSQAALMVDALGLPPATRTADAGGSRRCATSALLDAFERPGEVLIAAGEKRETQAGSAQQGNYGDGSAAVRVGDCGGARFLGGASLAHDFIDSYTSRDRPTPYAYEERFVREAGAAKLLVPAIAAALTEAGVAADKVTFAAVAEPLAGTYAIAARKLGLTAPNLATDLAIAAGDLGAAHALFALGLVFARANLGDIVLLAGFGSGCDAMLFEMVGEVDGARGVAEALTTGQSLTDYVRFLNLSGAINLAWGMRAEIGQKAQATVLERAGRDMMGFVGGRDSLGNVQFPKSAMPVNPALDRPETLADVRLADETGRIIAVTADRLNYTPDPPFEFGLVQFDNGARVNMEFVDRPAEGFVVGQPVRMRLRIKSSDRQRGFRTYFWKAAPLDRPLLETA